MDSQPPRSRARRLLILGLSLLLACAIGLVLYERFIGFEKQPLEEILPDNAALFVSVRHLRKTALAAADPQLRAAAGILQALLRAAQPPSPSEPTIAQPAPSPPRPPAATPADLAPYFKTHVALALLPVDPFFLRLGDRTHLLLLARFSGSENDLFETLVKLSPRYFPDLPADAWQSETHQGLLIRSVRLPPPSLPPAIADLVNLQDFAPAWSIRDGILFAAPSPDSLKFALDVCRAPPSSQDSLAANPALQRARSSDLFAYADANEIFLGLAFLAQTRLAADPANPLNLVRFPALVEALGLQHWQSLSASYQFTGDKPAYLGLRYSQRSGLLAALQPDSSPAIDSATVPIIAQESLTLDAGQLYTTARQAATKSAPLSAFAYLRANSQYRAITGIGLDDTFANAFLPDTRLALTFDTGSLRRPDGSVAIALVPDATLSFAIRPDSPLPSALPRLFQHLARQAPASFQFEQTPTRTLLTYSPDGYSTLSGRQHAALIADGRLTLASGTLGLLHRQADSLPNASPLPPATQQIGQGRLQLHDLPRQLQRAAPILFRQISPGQSLPQALLDFDWSQLQTLESSRTATTFDDGNGHLYRISRQN